LLDTSETSSFPWRLDLRHEAIFTMNRPLFEGARVLDIASHDGRWTLAALEAGAAHVTGIEARPELVTNAAETFAAAGIEPSRYEFVTGDVFEVLAKPAEYDVVLCLGFFYHTLRHLELVGRVRHTGARHVIIDTEVHRSPDPVMRIATEQIEREGNAVADLYTVGSTVITGRPTLAAMNLMMEAQGFSLDSLSDWDGLLRDNPDATEVRDYRIGRRLTAAYRRNA
jgi:ubiquinone/menaquinone biosynthesis C-methylase UbiE